jgi:2-hydroxy-6-oxonona-2,4-dienedioate hydrolase
MMSPTSRLQLVPVDGRTVQCHVLDPHPDPVFSPSLRLPVILLHGLGYSSEAWRPTLEVLAERRLPCPVLVPDMPGFGCSPGPKEALGMADLADWTARLMDALGVERAHLAGNSMGCQVALALARRQPDRVGGLALVGPTVGEEYISFWRYALGLLLDGVQEPPNYNLRLTRMYAQMGVPRYLATTRKMLEDEPLRHGDEVRAPCLIVRGARDGIIPDSVARRLAAALPRGEFRRLSGTAHALQFSRPREFVETALPFWAQAEACSSPISPQLFGPPRV